MPQRRCCVSSCTSTEDEGVTLHGFPNPNSDRQRFLKWVTNAGLAGEDEIYIFKNRRICRLHFENIYHYPKNRLCRLAIPRLLLSCTIEDAAEPIERMIVDELPSSSTLVASNTHSATQDTATQLNGWISRDLGCVQRQHEGATEVTANPIERMDVDNPRSSLTRVAANAQSHQFKSLSTTEVELYKAVCKTQAELKRCKKAKVKMSEKLKVAQKLSHSKAYQAVTKDLSPAAKIFFDMQIRQSCKHPKGHRFTLDEKILALSLYKPSPKAYRLLSQVCVLPKRSTLNKILKQIGLQPGPNEIIFEHLKKRVEKMPDTHKYCILLFDEMAITANLSYDKHNDYIKGWCDDGKNREKLFADHVLVFMVRGIFKKYKQPIAYSFCTGTTKTESLKEQIKNVLKKILTTGLKVVATTCDQGSTNMAAINSLINETKANYLRKEKEYEDGFFEIENQKIFPLFDPPHLMKGIRNNLITKNLEFQINGKNQIAKWAHLVALYKKGPGYKGVRLIPKLTARHVIPELIPKMKVKYSTQVFSRTVSVAMGFTAGTGRIPKESTDTADLLMFFDKLFDSVNGSYSKPVKGKMLRSAVTPKSAHHKLWYRSLTILKSMRFIGGRAGVVPSISSWIKTIKAFQRIVKILHNLGLRSLLLRNFNQDPLENFFGAIRAHGQGNIMPSCSAFEASYKALLLSNMTSAKAVGANCQSDDSYCLQSLKYFLTEKILRPVEKEIEFDIDHFNLSLPNIEDLLNSQSPADIEKVAAAAYCSGWLLSLLYEYIGKRCTNCKNDLEGDSKESFAKFISLKKYSSKCILHYPNKHLLEYFVNVEEITIGILKTHCQATKVLEYIQLIASSLTSLKLKCEQHKEKVSNFLLRKSITFFIMDWCKEINNILIGKNTVWDEGDPIKVLAHSHYLKNKTKKRVRETGVKINL